MRNFIMKHQSELNLELSKGNTVYNLMFYGGKDKLLHSKDF